jgi:hypothetical protein
MVLSHFARRNPEWVQWVTDDAAHSIDMMMKCDSGTTYSLSGRARRLSQLMCVAHTNGLTDYPKPIPCLAMVDMIGISDSTWIMKSKNNSNNIGDTDNFEKLIPNGKVDASGGGVAEDIIGDMHQALDELPSLECKGLSATQQHRGAPCAEIEKARNLERLTTQRNGKYRAFLVATICGVHWNLNSCFQQGSRVMIQRVDYKATVRLWMRIFMEAMEMGAVAERFPRATFTIGGSSKTQAVPQQFDVFANAARLGVALAVNNVASWDS